MEELGPTHRIHPPLRVRSQTTFTRGGGIGSQKMLTFCQHSEGRKCLRRGARWSKKVKNLST